MAHAIINAEGVTCVRKFDREITNRSEIDDLLERIDTGHLGMCEDSKPYVIPFNYFYDRSEGKIYIHCADEGHKIDIIKKNPEVCFEVAEVGVDENAVDQRCPEWWKSVVAFGTISFIEDIPKKLHALNGLIEKYGRSHKPATVGQAEMTTVLVIEIEEVTGKSMGPEEEFRKEKK
jgi:nitroimidazol reductase NimA-like FMN-containing flavoprotein (pyridoxamine 5'-phosphate oxidase superfamily)